MNILNIG